jgi:hypothetical protein
MTREGHPPGGYMDRAPGGGRSVARAGARSSGPIAHPSPFIPIEVPVKKESTAGAWRRLRHDAGRPPPGGYMDRAPGGGRALDGTRRRYAGPQKSRVNLFLIVSVALSSRCSPCRPTWSQGVKVGGAQRSNREYAHNALARCGQQTTRSHGLMPAELHPA